MSQAPVILPGSPLTGAAAAADMNAAWAAMVSKFSGTSAPTLGPGTSSILVEGQNWLDTSVSPHVWRMWDGAQWCPFAFIDPTNHLSYSASLWRNIIGSNGGFEVWQRGAGSSASFSFAATTTAYAPDRWYIGTGANQATTIAAVTGLVNGSRLACKVQRNNGQTGIGQIDFGFPLDTDECAMIAGQICTVSFTAKAGTNWSPAGGILSVYLAAGTGSPAKFFLGTYAGSTFPINNQSAVLTTSPQRFSFTTPLVVPSTTTQAEVIFVIIPVGTAGADDSFTVDDIQLEVASAATPFERWPFERMLLGCKRHYWKTFLYGTAPVTNAGANTGELHAIAGKAGAAAVALFARHPVSMRATPAVTTFNPSAANAQVRWESGATGDTSATATANLNTETVDITATGNGGAAVGDTLGVHLTVDAGI